MKWNKEVIIGKDSAMPERLVVLRNNTGEQVWYVPERTCHMRNTDWDTGTCSNCGYTEECDIGYATPNYCPNCGAKVVGK